MLSTKINEICNKYNIIPIWKPFLNSEQATKPYSSALNKIKYNKRLLLLHAQRTVNNPKFYQNLNKSPSTLDQMIFLTSIHDQGNATIIKCAKKLFHSIWIENNQNNNELNRIISDFKANGNYTQSLQKLKENTRNAAKKCNIFATPSVIINKTQLFVGIDRLSNSMLQNIYTLKTKRIVSENIFIYTVDAALNPSSLSPPTLRIKDVLPKKLQNKLEFYFDFSSPWAYLGYCRLYELKGFVESITFKPILLGALFRDIGTPNAPALAMSDSQRRYGSLEIDRWTNIAGVKLNFTKHFPIRTVLPLRVFIINNQTIDCIYRGAWQWNINIGDPKELCKLLNKYGFDGEGLIKQAKSDKKVKTILKDNTEFAKKKGLFGVPSYVVNGDYDRFIWGQEKLDFVKDLCCGWKPLVDIDSVAKL